MLKREMDIDTISEITELSVGEIKKLEAENQENFEEDKFFPFSEYDNFVFNKLQHNSQHWFFL